MKLDLLNTHEGAAVAPRHAAAITGTPRVTLWRWRRRGLVRTVEFKGRQLVLASELDWLRAKALARHQARIDRLT